MLEFKETEGKVFFLPGEKVQLKQMLPNQPIMVIVGKKTKTFRPEKDDRANFFQGMICMWFSTTGEKHESVFSTKDLVKVK